MPLIPPWLIEKLQKNCNLNQTGVQAVKPNSKLATGTRNGALASVAGTLRKHGLDESSILTGIAAINERLCETPLLPREVRTIAQSISKYKVTASSDSINNWGELKPIKLDYDVPSLRPDQLPSDFRPWLTDCCERMQIPLEFMAVPAVVAASSLIGRQIGIFPKKYDDWLVIPNLWGAIVARPGYFKSPAIAEALRPFDEICDQASKNAKQIEMKVQSEVEVLEGIEANLEDQVRKNVQKNNFDSLTALKDHLAKIKNQKSVLSTPGVRYKTNDATIEKLAVILQENSNGLLVVRDELAGWLNQMEKSGHEGAREFYLEAWNGYGSFTVDRVGRGTTHIDALCLSILGGIQPDKLFSYMENLRNSSFDWYLGRVPFNSFRLKPLLLQLIGENFLRSMLSEYMTETRFPSEAFGLSQRKFDLAMFGTGIRFDPYIANSGRD